MTTAEHQIKQGASGAVIEDTFPIDPAQNIVGASAQFVFRSPEGETNTVRSATFISESEDDTEADEITFSRVIGADAGIDPGVYVYEWKLTLADGSTLIFPVTGAVDDFPERETYTFEILEALSPSDVDSEEPVPTQLLVWAMSGAYVLSIDEDGEDEDGAEVAGTVIWPDQNTGVYTATLKNSVDPSLVDAFTLTHAVSGKTVTFPAVTRDDDGEIITEPMPTIS